MSPPPVRVLVVDDHPPLLELVTAILRRRAGVTDVIAAASVAEAVVALESATHVPDVAIIDDQMPQRDGLSLVAELAQRWPSIRTVLFTGADAVGVRERLVREGLTADAVVDKIDIGRLADVIDAVVGRSDDEAEAAE